jgi:hypothetical protein
MQTPVRFYITQQDDQHTVVKSVEVHVPCAPVVERSSSAVQTVAVDRSTIDTRLRRHMRRLRRRPER